MIKFTSRTAFYMRPEPTDMRNGRNGLAEIIRTSMRHDPYNYDEAFIFYSKDYRKIKILHYDINGCVLYEKWFDHITLVSKGGTDSVSNLPPLHWKHNASRQNERLSCVIRTHNTEV